VVQQQGTMKNLAFVIALLVLALGVTGLFVPSGLVWVGQHSLTPAALYGIAAARVLFGVILIRAAAASRAPRTLRILGSVIVLAGVATALAGLVAIERMHAMVDWWVQQESWLVRLSAVPVLALGSFIAYACAPARRA
jgi:hypothetical protein